MLFARRAIAGLATAAAILAATPAICADAAPNPHSLELAKKLFGEMKMDQMMDGMMRQMTPAMVAQARKTNPNLTDEQARAVTEAVTEASHDLMAKVVERVAPLYAETFTEKELQDLVNFYDSPSGHAMLEKMPKMMANMGPMMAELMPEMTADVTRRLCSKTDCTKMNAPAKPAGD
jgi:hypothetical protein